MSNVNESANEVIADTTLRRMHTKREISSSTLKLIAMITMLIDHTAAVVMYPVMMQSGETFRRLLGSGPMMYDVYIFLRQVIGRIAFPIFCFLLVEGFQRTGNAYRYALRMLCFALLSEIPFDLALNDVRLEFGYQNVMFTLLLGLLVLISCDKLEGFGFNRWLLSVGKLAVILLGMGAGELLRTDYGGYGVLCISVLYLFRKNRGRQIIAGTVAFVAGEYVLMGSLSELLAPLGFIPVACYNGKRGLKLKYLFYFFYPAHLFVLYMIRMIML